LPREAEFDVVGRLLLGVIKGDLGRRHFQGGITIIDPRQNRSGFDPPTFGRGHLDQRAGLVGGDLHFGHQVDHDRFHRNIGCCRTTT
jgi:hypothetical protein